MSRKYFIFLTINFERGKPSTDFADYRRFLPRSGLDTKVGAGHINKLIRPGLNRYRESITSTSTFSPLFLSQARYRAKTILSHNFRTAATGPISLICSIGAICDPSYLLRALCLSEKTDFPVSPYTAQGRRLKTRQEEEVLDSVTALHTKWRK